MKTDKFEENTSPEDEKILLSRILDKLNDMDQRIHKLSSIVDQIPEVVTDAANVMDQQARIAQLRNQDPEQRIGETLTLLDRLTQTDTLLRIQSMLDLSEQLPDVMSDVANIFDSVMRQAREKGIDVEERCYQVQNLLETASSPEILDLANQALEATKQSDDMITFAVDQVDDWARFLTDNGLDISTLGKEGTQIISVLYTAYNETVQKPVPRVNAFGLLKAMSNSDFQKFVGFLIELGKNVSKQLPVSEE